MTLLGTPVTEQLGIEVPILCGAMSPCSNPELVAAASEAGAMGVLQPLSLVYVHGHEFRAGLELIRGLTSKPVNDRAGGHAGPKSAEELYGELHDLGVPLVCAGGVGDEEAFVRALRMGYGAVQMGTRFIATAECTAHPCRQARASRGSTRSCRSRRWCGGSGRQGPLPQPIRTAAGTRSPRGRPSRRARAPSPSSSVASAGAEASAP